MGIYVGTNILKGVYIWEFREWKPWEHTLAYYPLTSETTTSDMSGNRQDLTISGTSTFGEFGWVNCCQINPWYLYSSTAIMPGGWTERTISFWQYMTTLPSTYPEYLFSYGNTANYGAFCIRASQTSNKPYNIFIRGTWDLNSSVSATTWVWKLHVLTYKEWTMNYYINWSLVYTTSDYTLNTAWNATSTYPFCIGALNTDTSSSMRYKGYMSNFIVENKARTLDFLSTYFNKMKADYWIS